LGGSATDDCGAKVAGGFWPSPNILQSSEETNFPSVECNKKFHLQKFIRKKETLDK